MTPTSPTELTPYYAERRRWGRFVSDVGQLRIACSGGFESSAQVADESFGGIGLVVRELGPLAVGTHLDLNYDGVPMSGIVKSIVEDSSAGYRIGVEWTDGLPAGPQDDGGFRVEGSLLMLIRMWQSGEWRELRRTAETLRRESEQYGAQQVARCARSLRDAVDQRLPKEAILAAVESLVEMCTESSAVPMTV